MKTDKITSFFKNRTNIIGIILALSCTFIHIPRYFDGYFPPLTPSPEPWWGLDMSWIITLNYVNLKQMVWGTDFAFTYGPLANFSTRTGWGTSGNGMILFDIFFYLNLFLIYFISFTKSSKKIVTALLIIGYTLLIPVFIGPPISLLLLIFLVFWVRLSIDNPRAIYYVFQAILLYLLFFIKFNTGLVAFPLFIIGLGYNCIAKKAKIYWLLLYFSAPIILILVACGYLNVAFSDYVKTAMEMVSGYNDIMYLEHDTGRRVLAIFVGLSTVFVLVHKLIAERKNGYARNGAILLLYSIPIFVFYKSGFTRGLETDFFIYSVPLILVIRDLHFENYKKYSGIVVVACLLSSFGIVYFDNGTKMPFETVNKLDKYYLIGIKDYTPVSGLHIFPNDNQIPVSVKAKINTATVDIYPWNSQLLFENKLNFLPRPVFQSYAAYTKVLEDMNFSHYNSKEKAPEFVIYEYLSFDLRYPLFDEPKVNLCLLKNYSPLEIFDFQNRKFVLLKKRDDFKPIKLEKAREYEMEIGASLAPAKDIYYEVGVSNSIVGKFVSVIDHAPEMTMEIKSNSSSEYRTGKKLLESGLFLEKKINKTEDFYSLFFADSLAKMESVEFYKFKPKSPSLFKDKIKITEYKITQ